MSRERVSGRPAHDARLAALMESYGLRQLLTLNPQDFKRFANIDAITPGEFVK